MTARSRLAHRSLFLLAALLPAAPAPARVVSTADNPLVNLGSFGRAIQAPALGGPRRLPSDRDVRVLASVGGAFCNITVVGRSKVSADRLADTMDAVLDGRAEVDRYADKDFSCASAALDTSRFGRLDGTTTPPLARLDSALRAAGLRPHTILRVSKWAEVSGAGPAPFRYKRYAFRNLNPPAEGLTVRVRLGFWRMILLFLTAALPTAGAILMIATWTAGLLRRRSGAPAPFVDVAESRASCLIVLGMLVYFPITTATMWGGTAAMAGDLWLGEPTGAVLLVGLSVPLVILGFLCLVQSASVQGRAGALMVAAGTGEDVTAIPRWRRVLLAAPTLVGIVLIFGRQFALPAGAAQVIALWVAVALIFGGSSAVGWLLRRLAPGKPARR
ncbi:MAG TPA: hypothetical protein VGM37_21110 [Armatimonadota bacterium]|jgi:hypothetical protein